MRYGVGEPAGNLRTVSHKAIEDAKQERAADELTVLVTVVDSDARTVLETIRATISIVIGVSAGAATAEQLATLAKVGEDRAVAGVLIAKPMTTGREIGPIPGLPSESAHRPASGKSDITAAGRPGCDLLV